jgi:hypothetical protein
VLHVQREKERGMADKGTHALWNSPAIAEHTKLKRSKAAKKPGWVPVQLKEHRSALSTGAYHSFVLAKSFDNNPPEGTIGRPHPCLHVRLEQSHVVAVSIIVVKTNTRKK